MTQRPPTESEVFFDRYFWRIFAVGCAVSIAVMIYTTNFSRHRQFDLRVENKQTNDTPDGLYRVIDEQKEAAIVYFKHDSRTATGVVSDADSDYVVLRNFDANANVEHYMIPWENVLYIKMNLGPLKEEKK